MSFIGFWHITKMEKWDEDYIHMEVPAYIEVEEDHLGDFQFGLVYGQLDGEVIRAGRVERFWFTWDGDDEGEPMSGGGWLELSGQNALKGRIKLHLGDSSDFWAVRVM
jgi:hypothetical protein